MEVPWFPALAFTTPVPLRYVTAYSLPPMAPVNLSNPDWLEGFMRGEDFFGACWLVNLEPGGKYAAPIRLNYD